MKYIFMLSIMLLLISCCCKTERQNETEIVLNGKLMWTDWQKHAGWDSYDSDYEAEKEKIKELRMLVQMNRASFIVFGASWCEDSEIQMPKIFKLLSDIGISPALVPLYALDRDKKDSEGMAEKYNIEKVPTIVVIASDHELGRIVEYPEVSLEDDLKKILTK